MPKDKSVIYKAASQFDMIEGDSIALESEDDLSYLLDYLLYEKCLRGRPFLIDFYESDVELTTEEEEIIENMIEAYSSIFQIIEIDRNNKIILLKDLLAKETKLYRLIDLNLSQTAVEDIIIATRLIKFDEFYFTSGASYTFPGNKMEKLMSDLSFARFKKRGRFLSCDLFVFLYKKSKEYGIVVRTQDVKM